MIQQPEIYTSHWRSPLLADVDAQIVSISRGQPRWGLPFRYRKLSELAPCDDAWNAHDQQVFERAYLDQLEHLGAEWILDRLAAIGDGRPVVLLCWERPNDAWCHRWQLADWLHAQTGIEVPELEAGMLRTRPDAPQPSLFDHNREESI